MVSLLRPLKLLNASLQVSLHDLNLVQVSLDLTALQLKHLIVRSSILLALWLAYELYRAIGLDAQQVLQTDEPRNI